MITIHFDSKALAEELKVTDSKVRELIEGGLRYAGREAVNAQRRTKWPQSYHDQSGNLRSSTNFVVASGGQIKAVGEFEPIEGLNPAKDSLSPQQASDEGIRVAHEVAEGCNEKPTLVLVAGMNYASYVSDKGLDVLSTARIVAEESVRQWLEDLSER